MRILISGANRGLGYELTRLFAEQGHQVIAGSYAGNDQQQLTELAEQYPGLITMVPLDITDDVSVAQDVAATAGKFGALDALVNSAGILLAKDKQIDELDLAEMRQTFEINTFSQYRMIKGFLPLIYKGENPCILNITSEASSITNVGVKYCSYSMSKVAFTMMSQMFSNLLEPQGIRVIAVHPGRMNTVMGRETAQMEASESAAGIYKLITGEVKVTEKVKFVNYAGKPMQL